jgi:hypothetical protein
MHFNSKRVLACATCNQCSHAALLSVVLQLSTVLQFAYAFTRYITITANAAANDCCCPRCRPLRLLSQALSALTNAVPTCTVQGVTATAADLYISFQWPLWPADTNLWYHNGNPPTGAFGCDTSGLTASSTKSCTIVDMRSMTTTVQLTAASLAATYTSSTLTPEKFNVVFTPSVTGGVPASTAVHISPEALQLASAAADTATVSTACALTSALRLQFVTVQCCCCRMVVATPGAVNAAVTLQHRGAAGAMLSAFVECLCMLVVARSHTR